MTDPLQPIVLYEEGPCLVVLKPAGLLSQAPPGIDSLEVRMKEFIKQREQKPGNVYLALAHRLDRPVSGLLVLARHVRAAKRLGKQFERRSVRKLYWAAVSGEVTPAAGTWTDFVRKIPNQPRAEIVPEDHPEGRLARLHYRTIGRTAHGSWLEVELETGRMHQIRIQAASRGWPIVGDEHYGATIPYGPQLSEWRRQPIALHGQTLEFEHPMSRAPVRLTADPLPPWKTLQAERIESPAAEAEQIVAPEPAPDAGPPA